LSPGEEIELMTIRQLGEVAIKLLGVYFAASAVHGLAGVLAMFAGPQLEGFPTAGEVATANAIPLVAGFAVAAVCLFAGGSLARVLFADERFAITGLSRFDLLVAGVALLGLSIALAGVPGILQIAGVAVWYAEGSRQPLFMATMEGWWDTLVNSGLSLLVGGFTAASAARIASALNARFTALPGSSRGGDLI
jgi:hypothetical protein